jgi:hypothetical protein
VNGWHPAVKAVTVKAAKASPAGKERQAGQAGQADQAGQERQLFFRVNGAVALAPEDLPVATMV